MGKQGGEAGGDKGAGIADAVGDKNIALAVPSHVRRRLEQIAGRA